MKTRRIWIFSIILTAIVIGLFIFIKWSFTPRLAKPSVDISAVPRIEYTNASTVLVTHADGSTAHVHTIAYDLRFLFEGRVYAGMYLIPGVKVRLDAIQGYAIHDTEYVYYFSFNGLPKENWLVCVYDRGKPLEPSDFTELTVYKNLEITQIPDELAGILIDSDK